MIAIGPTLSYLLQSAMILALCFLWVAALLDIRSQVRRGVSSPSILVLIAIATSRIPEIEAPSEHREASTEATEQPGRVEPQAPLEEPSERPWWRRVFGG
jgi:outer membrane biosynthesis protein TonB